MKTYLIKIDRDKHSIDMLSNSTGMRPEAIGQSHYSRNPGAKFIKVLQIGDKGTFEYSLHTGENGQMFESTLEVNNEGKIVKCSSNKYDVTNLDDDEDDKNGNA